MLAFGFLIFVSFPLKYSCIHASANEKCRRNLTLYRVNVSLCSSSYFYYSTNSTSSYQMYEAVFQILRDSRSLELTITSYQLLQDLEKRFPRATVAKVEGLPPSDTEIQFVWSPFVITCENDSTETEGHLATDSDHIDCSKLYSLTQDIADQFCHGVSMYFGRGPVLNGSSNRLIYNIMPKMMIFQYIVSILKRDFIWRCQAFKKNQKWPVIRDSLLNQLLGSHRMNFRKTVTNLLHIVAANTREDCAMNHDTEHDSDYISKTSLRKHDLAEPEFRHTLCLSAETLLTLMMELDTLQKKANQNRLTSRSDGSRTPVLEIVIDELSYNKKLISPYLKGMTEVKWKTNIILTYFSKYCPKCIKMFGEATIKDVFNCFSNVTNLRNTTKRMGEDVIQLLLVHGFQAYFSLQHSAYCFSHVKANGKDGALLQETCQSFITTFRNLKSIYKELELVGGAREALFIATTILS